MTASIHSKFRRIELVTKYELDGEQERYVQNLSVQFLTQDTALLSFALQGYSMISGCYSGSELSYPHYLVGSSSWTASCIHPRCAISNQKG